MAGNGAACGGFIDSGKMAVLLDAGFYGLQGIIGNGGVGQEQLVADDIIPIGQAILNIGGKALGIAAAVLFHNTHFAALDLNAGLQTQQVGTQRGNAGAAATLDHVLQLIQQEAGFHPGGEGIQLFHDLIEAAAFGCQTAGFQHHQAVAGGEVLRVDHPDVGKFLGGQAGILIAGGEAGADGDMNDTVVLTGIFGEQLLVLTDVVGGGGAKVAAGSNMGEDVGRGDGSAIRIGLAILDDGQPCKVDIVLRQQFGGQVTGAVGQDLDIHR